MSSIPPRTIRGARVPARATSERCRTKAKPVSETPSAPGGPTIDEQSITAPPSTPSSPLRGAPEERWPVRGRQFEDGVARVLPGLPVPPPPPP